MDGFKTYHIFRQFGRHITRNMANLVTHDIVYTDSISIIRVTRLPFENNVFANSSLPSIVAYAHDLRVQIVYLASTDAKVSAGT